MKKLKLDRPNELQLVRLRDIAPSDDNVRLFIERESLGHLRQRYRQWAQNPATVLPDPPVVRYRDGAQILELLAGHRRVEAAHMEGLDSIPARVVCMTDEEAYEFIILANQYEGVTTAELAFKAAEMERLGFERERISEVLGGVSVGRYLHVGRLLAPDLFTDEPKLCDPSITLWEEAAQHGLHHFMFCFHNWNAGVWNEEMCRKRFRTTGRPRELPLDNKAKGVRLSITKDGRQIKLIGTVDLDMWTDDELDLLFDQFVDDFYYTVRNGTANRETTGFGRRRVVNYNPSTLGERA